MRPDFRARAQDLLFWHAEVDGAPQHVGGFALVAPRHRAEGEQHAPEALTRERLVHLVAERLDKLARFDQRLCVDPGRRPRWEQVARLEWAWHIRSWRLAHETASPSGVSPDSDCNVLSAEAATPATGAPVRGTDGSRPSEEILAWAARMAAEPLDRARPLWELHLLEGLQDGRCALVLKVHHALADGMGAVNIFATLLDEHEPAPEVDQLGSHLGPSLRRGSRRHVSSRSRFAAVALGRKRVEGPGSAVQALKGLVHFARQGAAPLNALTGPATARHCYVTAALPLDRLRLLARRADVGTTQLLIAAVAAGFAEAFGASRTSSWSNGPRAATTVVRVASAGDLATSWTPSRGAPQARAGVSLASPGARELMHGGAGGDHDPGEVIRVIVPVSVRSPDARDTAGSWTAGLRVDLPVGPMTMVQRVHAVGEALREARSAGQIQAAQLLVHGLGRWLPRPLHAKAARAVYQGKWFSAIVTSLPGPRGPRWLAGHPIEVSYPVVPLARDVPLAVGTLRWGEQIAVGVTCAAWLREEADRLPLLMQAALRDLAAEVGLVWDA